MESGSIPKVGIQERCMSQRLVAMAHKRAVLISLFRIVKFAGCCHPSVDLKAS